MGLPRAILTGGAIVALATAAFAQKAEPVRTPAFGGIDFEIDGDRVAGTYPKFQGRLSGTVIARDIVAGIWTQPGSKQPCATQRNGTNAWGRFIITNWGAATMGGYWGYCADKPEHDIGFQ